MPRPLIFLRIRTQFDNLGDALINRELLRLCGAKGDLVINIAHAPRRFREWIDDGIPADAILTGPFGYWRRLIVAAMRRPFSGRAFWIVLNPGGYVGEISRVAALGKLFGVGRIAILRRLGAKTLLIGVSYERLGPRLGLAIRALSARLDHHLPRDRQTGRYCAANGIRYDGTLPDLALNMPYRPRTGSGTARALASFRSDGGTNQIEALKAVLPKDGTLDFAWQVVSDSELQIRLCQDWRSLGNEPRLIDLTQGIEPARACYGAYDVVFSNRLHVLLLAMSVGALPIPVLRQGHGEKIRGLYADLGLQDLVVEADNPSAPAPTYDQHAPTLRAGQAYQLAGERLRNGFAKVMAPS